VVSVSLRCCCNEQFMQNLFWIEKEKPKLSNVSTGHGNGNFRNDEWIMKIEALSY